VTPSNETLFGEPGRFYIYLSYGIVHRAGWHSRRGSSNGSDTAAFVFWPCTAQSVERSTILARPSTRLSSDKRCCLVVQKTNTADRDLQGLLLNQIRQEYAKIPKVRLSR